MALSYCTIQTVLFLNLKISEIIDSYLMMFKLAIMNLDYFKNYCIIASVSSHFVWFTTLYVPRLDLKSR